MLKYDTASYELTLFILSSLIIFFSSIFSIRLLISMSKTEFWSIAVNLTGTVVFYSFLILLLWLQL